MKDVSKYALINSFGTALYIVAVSSLIYFLGNRNFEEGNLVLAPVAMLMLFVFSAAVTGFLVLGKPLMWYIDGKKKEALSLLFYTLGIFLAMTVIVFVLLIVMTGNVNVLPLADN